jgi:hypothetical protein
MVQIKIIVYHAMLPNFDSFLLIKSVYVNQDTMKSYPLSNCVKNVIQPAKHVITLSHV